MKKILAFFAIIFILSSTQAQTVFYSENFNNGCTSLCLANTYAGWSISNTGTNGAFANNWYISCAENGLPPGSCGAGCGNDATLHISNVAGSPGGLCPTGDCGAAYDASLASVVTNRRVESPLISTAGISNVRLRYDYIASGSAGTDFYEVVYSTDGGGTWLSLTTGPTSTCCCSFLDCFLSVCCAPSTTTCGSLRQGNWTQVTLALPATTENIGNLRIGFNWTNNGDNIGTDPSVAINNLQLIGDVVLPVQIPSFSGQRIGQNMELTWSGASIEGLTRFEIEKSLDGIHFEKAGSIEAENGRRNRTYRFTDWGAGPERLYYRLVLINTSGKKERSEVLEISPFKADRRNFSFFPNPLQGNELSIQYKNQESGLIQLELFDLRGKRTFHREWQASAGEHRNHLQLPSLPVGMYILQFKTPGESIREILLLR